MSAADPSLLLRRSLGANAAFSASSGLLFAIGGDAIARSLGDLPPILVRLVGVQLVLFAAALAWLASRNAISAPLTLAVIVADIAWVAATVAVVSWGVLASRGDAAAILVAAVVLLLAVLQWVGLRRVPVARTNP